ncbi:hypothetical protein ACQPZP_37990 [Spirillospora sp. CA-142024]|uniref:hypothetical protein n=1 Tax=Spirillospora sp. CA-142024 TaxID=3240036 RepID=UPI003D9014A7
MDQAPARERPVTLNVPDRPAITRPDREAAEAVDDDRARPRRRPEGAEGLVAAYLAGPCTPPIARWAAGRGLTAGAVSMTSLAFAVLAAVWFSGGARGGLVTGALLLYASLVLGKVGAGLARRANPFTSGPASCGGRPPTPPGKYHPAVLDRVKEFAVYAGLAAGATASGGNPWWPATGAVALLSVRHTVAASYAASRTARRPPPSRRGLVVRRAAKSLRLPLGERFALISLTAAFADARLTFAVLLAWGSAATACALAGRVTRSISP